MTNYSISSLKKGLIAHYPLNSKSEKVGGENKALGINWSSNGDWQLDSI